MEHQISRRRASARSDFFYFFFFFADIGPHRHTPQKPLKTAFINCLILLMSAEPFILSGRHFHFCCDIVPCRRISLQHQPHHHFGTFGQNGQCTV